MVLNLLCAIVAIVTIVTIVTINTINTIALPPHYLRTTSSTSTPHYSRTQHLQSTRALTTLWRRSWKTRENPTHTF